MLIRTPQRASLHAADMFGYPALRMGPDGTGHLRSCNVSMPNASCVDGVPRRTGSGCGVGRVRGRPEQDKVVHSDVLRRLHRNVVVGFY